MTGGEPLERDAIVARAYAEHRAALVRYLAAVVRDEVVAEDIAQEAFLRLAREVRAGRTPDNVAGWLRRVGSNLAVSRGRRAQVAQRFAPALERPGSDRSPEDVAVDAEQHAALRRAVDALPPVDRAAVVLAARGFRGPEIARLIGRTELATRTLLCRARGRIRRDLLAQGVA